MSEPTALSRRVSEISDMLCTFENECADAVKCTLADLADYGATRSFTAAQKHQIAKTVARIAVRELIAEADVNAPDEVRWLHVDRFADTLEAR